MLTFLKIYLKLVEEFQEFQRKPKSLMDLQTRIQRQIRNQIKIKNIPKGNRFAQQYSQPKKKNDLNSKPKNQNRFTKEEKVELDRTQQYNMAKKALKEKEKNQAQSKQQTNKTPSPKPRQQKPTKKAETKVENIRSRFQLLLLFIIFHYHGCPFE